jgi:nicotinamidase-related amidase
LAFVISMLNYKTQTEQPVLVLVGLHEPEAALSAPESIAVALARCAETLAIARARRMSVAFVRRVAPPPSVSEPTVYPAWLKGFEPQRNDLVFDILQPSCYSNAEFARTMDYSNGNFVIAGLFAETTCLATAVDAHHRRHDFAYLSDASASGQNGAIAPATFHEAVSQLISLYGVVAHSSDWNLGLPLNRHVR